MNINLKLSDFWKVFTYIICAQITKETMFAGDIDFLCYLNFFDFVLTKSHLKMKYCSKSSVLKYGKLQHMCERSFEKMYNSQNRYPLKIHIQGRCLLKILNTITICFISLVTLKFFSIFCFFS